MDIRNGVLCQLGKSKGNPKEKELQIVLPAQYWFDILKMAHDVPMTGHEGVKRPLQRIRKCFWWPGVTKDVKTNVQPCPECQKVARQPTKVPLVKLPITGKSFEWITMDITGPLSKTTSGHQYILVISDYMLQDFQKHTHSGDLQP